LNFYFAILTGCDILAIKPHLYGDVIRISLAVLERISSMSNINECESDRDQLVKKIISVVEKVDTYKVETLEKVQEIVLSSGFKEPAIKCCIEATAKAKPSGEMESISFLHKVKPNIFPKRGRKRRKNTVSR